MMWAATLRRWTVARRNAPAALVRVAEKATAAAPPPLAELSDSFLSGASASALEALEADFDRGASVPPSWEAFFRAISTGARPAELAAQHAALSRGAGASASLALAPASAMATKVLALTQAFQTYGHREADLDPLGMHRGGVTTPPLDVLTPSFYGLSPDEPLGPSFPYLVPTAGLVNVTTANASGVGPPPPRTVGELVAVLRGVYAGKIGYEFTHIDDPAMRAWLLARIERGAVDGSPSASQGKTLSDGDMAGWSLEAKRRILDRLTRAVTFEDFLSTKFPATKRFGLDGGWAFIPGMQAMVDAAAACGVEQIEVAMAHRGRLNVLANVVGKPLEQILSEFSLGMRPATGGEEEEEVYTGSGDVKYHLGTSNAVATPEGRSVRVSVLANPSHLEAVSPVALGKTRAKQFFSKDHDRSKVMCVLVHGDASHCGQGVVYETYDMSGLPDYTVGGTIHVIVNNQIGYTTDPKFSRSSPYCTDVATSLDAPIFHVNGDCVESVCRVFDLAARWRQRFKTDVVVDLVCYRKFGHNEGDEPSFTQPLMYQTIKAMDNTLAVYSAQLQKRGDLVSDEIHKAKEAYLEELREAFDGSKTYEQKDVDWLESVWKGFKSPTQQGRIKTTGVPMDVLKEVGMAMSTIPEGFAAHRKVRKIYEQRKRAIETGEGVDWGTAEALAFATLLKEGVHVRVSGQDVERGTFAHRHAVVHDQKTGERYVPLKHLWPEQDPDAFAVSNSPLSEYGVLGFELGYSLVNPNQLVIWEAQFGDFANGAQVIFDQFLSSGEAKWLRQSGLVVNLPHGYEGAGPEHSSARMERFLQMCCEEPFEIPEGALHPDSSDFFEGRHLGTQIQKCNWQVVNPSTPANYFHLLRRQVHREFRKPLIVIAPKFLLKYRECVDSLDNFDDDAENDRLAQVRFKRLIMDAGHDGDRSPSPKVEHDVKRVLFCTGKVYYTVDAERQKQDLGGAIHMVRVEQISPWPYDLVIRELRRYPNAEIMWLQEEPKNMGAYLYAEPRFYACMKALGREPMWPLPYAGRPSAAVPATGFSSQHTDEEADLIADALDLS